MEPSIRLRELGVSQNSFFCWETTVPYACDLDLVLSHEKTIAEGIQHYAAYTVAELGAMLQGHLCRTDYYKKKITVTREPHLLIFNCTIDSKITYEKEADARANMLIYLLENKLINLAEVNRALAGESDV